MQRESGILSELHATEKRGKLRPDGSLADLYLLFFVLTNASKKKQNDKKSPAQF